MENNESKDLLDELRKIFYDNRVDITSFDFPGGNNLKILNIDDLVNLKWNIMKLICENDTSVGKDKYKEFFGDTSNQEDVNKFAFTGALLFLDAFLSNIGVNALSIRWSEGKELNKFAKLEIGNSIDELKNGFSDVQLESNNDLVKIFKAIYYLSIHCEDKNEPVADVKMVFEHITFMKKLIGAFFNEEQAQDFIVALKNIDKIKCDDQVFKEFQECCKNIKFDDYISRWGIKCDDTLESVDSNTEHKLSTKKLLLLMLTVVFLTAVIFFAMNFILAFFALEKILAMVLSALTTIAFVTFLAISIKNDVINKPQFFGGKKSFIDLYQNEENKEEKPELDAIKKAKERDMQ